jgi:hypothetical protein
MYPAPRARPLADLPIDALAERGGELARRWAVALVLARPLERIGEVPLEEIALEGPSICVQVLLAMESDAELARLAAAGAGGGRESEAARRLPAIVGAGGAADLVHALEGLRGVLWEALLAELREPPARLLAEVCDRLAQVCAVTLTAAVAGLEAAAAGRLTGAPGDDEEAGVPTWEALRGADPQAGPSAQHGRAVIVDELLDSPAPAHTTSLRTASAPRPDSGEIAVRDERGGGGEGPAAWVGSIGQLLERYEVERAPFAVLLVQIVGLDRRRAQELPDEAVRLTGEVERTLGAELASPPQEVGGAGGRGHWDGRATPFTRERPGRYWVLVEQTDRAGAERIAEQLTRAVDSLPSARRAGVSVAIGTASCPQDGTDAAALAAHADVGSYAARAAARGAGAAGAGRAQLLDQPA